MEANPVAGLRAALENFPENSTILVIDETGGLYRLREVAGVNTPEGPALVFTVYKVGQDPSADGWTGINDLPPSEPQEGDPRC